MVGGERKAKLMVAGVVLALLLAYLLAVIWPLPRYFSRGIPSSSTNIESPCARNMISGDHLQINYFYWIFSDMLQGKTRFLYNPYEFNKGDDDQCYAPGGYNVPYSFVYALGLLSGNRCVAWNFMLLVVALLSGVLFYLYMRQLLISRALAMALACVHVGLPYRWVSAMGGSPTGIAMVCVPLLMLGVHLFVAKRRWSGYLMALVALLIVYADEYNVFLFGVLTLPFTSLIAVFHGRDRLFDRTWREWGAVAWRLGALMAIIAGMGLRIMFTLTAALEGSATGSDRPLSEVAGFSPQPIGLIKWLENGTNAHAFIGVGAFLFLIVFGVHLVLHVRRRGVKASLGDPAVLLPAMLWAFLIGAVCLALGTNGPIEYLALRVVRKLIPGMDLLRQPAKVYCVVAFFLPVAAALSLMGRERIRRSSYAVGLVLAAWLAIEYIPQVRPTVCMLPATQGAYAAVRADADAQGKEPHAVVLPLWPGDSSWASLYEYYVSLYRIRMVNGYRPFIPPDYYEDVYETLGAMNCGQVDAAAIDTLRAMKVEYVIFHEDAFPEKVSPFPVIFTLDQLIGSGYFELLHRDGSIWAFRLKETPAAAAVTRLPPPDGTRVHFPSRFWDFAHQLADGGRQVELADGGRAAVMSPQSRVLLPYVNAWGADQAAVTVRVKGTGSLLVELDDYRCETAVDATDWQWIDLPLPAEPVGGEMTIRGTAGELLVQSGFLAAGPWRELVARPEFRLPASWFYHAGHMDAACQTVQVRRDWEPADRIWYGLGLPLPAGRYEFRLEYASKAPPGVLLGQFRCQRWPQITAVDVVGGGTTASLEVDVADGTLPRLDFQYTRAHDLTLVEVVVRRLPAAAE